MLSNQFATIGTKSFVPKVRIDSKSSNFANVVDINIILYRVLELRIYIRFQKPEIGLILEKGLIDFFPKEHAVI